MRSQHGLTVALAIARALRYPPDLRRVDAARRAGSPSFDSPAAFAAGVVGLATRLGLTVLARPLSTAEARAALEGGALPLVFVRATDAGVDVFVATAVARGQATGDRIGPDLDERTIALSVDDVLAHWHRDGDEVLVPIAVPSSGAGAWEGDGGHVRPFSRLLRLLGQERRLVATVYLYASIAGLFSLTLPLGVQAIIGLVSGGLILQPIVLLIGFVVLGTLASGVLQVMQLGVVESVQQRVFARLAFELTGRLSRARLDRVSNTDLPELMNRFFEIKTIQKSLGKLLTDWVTSGLQVVFGLVLLSFYHPLFFLFGALLVFALGLVFWWTAPRGWDTSLGESKYKYRVAHWLEELARTVRTHRFGGRSTLPTDRMDDVVGGYLDYRQAHFRVLVRQSVAFIGLRTLVTAGMLVLGSVLVVDREITLGQFVAAELVIVTVLLAIEKLILGLADVYDILTALQKAGQAASLEPEPLLGIAPPDEESTRGLRVALRDLSFTFPGAGRPAVRDVDLAIAPGERQGVTGPHGSGASTLLSVVAALYPEFSGALAYDGRSLRDLDPVRLRARMGYCGMEPALFDGTIEDNISLGRPGIRTEHVLEAASRVGLDAWLHANPDGLQAPVAVGGRAMPQSFARRLVIARAIVGAPRLVLVDGFLDAFDPPDRRAMADLLFAPDAPWTLVIVSHHPSILSRCDRVAVLQDGTMVANEPFTQLEGRNPYLRQLTGIA